MIYSYYSLLATIVRPSLVANLFSPKQTTANKVPRCGQCEKDEAKVVNKYSK